jgi:thiamine-monophosphate kinase
MGETLADIGEFGLIDRINEFLQREGLQAKGVTLGIGDDTAAFCPREGFELLITCDSLVEGRHYLPGHIKPRDLGRRAMTVNISDIGAVGGFPLYALVSLGLRAETKLTDVEEMYRGFLEELNPFGGAVVGGNITKVKNDIFIDITLVGEVEKDKIVRRSTARAGDVILVTGYPGQAAAGLDLLLHSQPDGSLYNHPLVRAYISPSHRALEGQKIASLGFATAMIDTSDGLLADLAHICQDSGVGADLIRDSLPVSKELLAKASADNISPYELCIKDSDDYELIITCPPDNVEKIKSAVAQVSGVPVAAIGTMTDKAGSLHWILPDGNRQHITPSGWDHFSEQGEEND